MDHYLHVTLILGYLKFIESIFEYDVTKRAAGIVRNRNLFA